MNRMIFTLYSTVITAQAALLLISPPSNDNTSGLIVYGFLLKILLLEGLRTVYFAHLDDLAQVSTLEIAFRSHY
jgi:hypothetical protein